MDLLELATYLNDIGNYAVVVPISLGIFYFRRNHRLHNGLLAGLSLILLQLLFFLIVGIRSSFVFFYVSTFLELLIFIILYSIVPQRSSGKKVGLTIGIVLLFLFPVDALFVSGINDFGVSAFLGRVYLIGASIAILTRLFRANLDENIFKNPVVWLCFGLIVNNYVGSFNVFSLKIMSYSQVLVLQFYMIWALTRILMYAAFSYSFYLSARAHD